MTKLDDLALHMITYYAADPARIQHFIKVHSFAALIARQEGMDAETLADGNNFLGMFGRQIYFKAVSHIEYLVHLCPVRIALLFNRFEQRRNREQIILNHAAIVTYKVQHFRLCTTRAVYHTVDLRAKCIQQLLHYRRKV